MEFNWHPFGKLLYYRYPNNPVWYAFLPETEQFVVMGDYLPGGELSRDARYRINSYFFPSEEREERMEAGTPIPNLQVWDSETGATRLYCVPHFEGVSINGEWSPDGRYWIFQDYLPEDTNYPSPPFRTFVLDVQTGSVTEISQLAGEIILWMEESYP
jgi:hypothetical protein